MSAARIHRLLDTRVTGLPAQLAARPGPDTGLVTVHKRAAGEVHALRRLALPATVGLIETSGGQEDVQSFGWEAAESLRQAIRHGHAVTSCELLTAYRAVTLSPHLVPPGCRALMDSLTGRHRPHRSRPPLRRRHRAPHRRILATRARSGISGIMRGWTRVCSHACPGKGTRKITNRQPGNPA